MKSMGLKEIIEKSIDLIAEYVDNLITEDKTSRNILEAFCKEWIDTFKLLKEKVLTSVGWPALFEIFVLYAVKKKIEKCLGVSFDIEEFTNNVYHFVAHKNEKKIFVGRNIAYSQFKKEENGKSRKIVTPDIVVGVASEEKKEPEKFIALFEVKTWCDTPSFKVMYKYEELLNKLRSNNNYPMLFFIFCGFAAKKLIDQFTDLARKGNIFIDFHRSKDTKQIELEKLEPYRLSLNDALDKICDALRKFL